MKTAARVALVMLTACGSSKPPAQSKVALHQGDTSAAPSIRVLPEIDVPESQLTQRMRFGMELAAEAMEVAMPGLPDDRSVQGLQKWSESELQNWLMQKSRAIAAARKELDGAAEESHRQRIIAGAVVGLMYEDVGLSLRNVPVPLDLQEDQEAAKLFAEVVESQANPYFKQSKQAYEACVGNAWTGPETMAHFRRFCSMRAEQLPDKDALPQSPLVVPKTEPTGSASSAKGDTKAP